MKCWVHKDMYEVRDEVTPRQGVQDAWDDATEKDTCTINLTGPEKDFWMGSEAGMLGCYWFDLICVYWFSYRIRYKPVLGLHFGGCPLNLDIFSENCALTPGKHPQPHTN